MMGGLIAYIVIALIVGSIAAGVFVHFDLFYGADGFGVFFGALTGVVWIVTAPLTILVGLVWFGHKAVIAWLDKRYNRDEDR